HLCIRVMDDECPDGRAIRSFVTLDTCARMGAHAVVRGFRATLSPRRTSMAGVEHLRPADARTHPQFHFSGEYQFPGNYRHPPLPMGRRHRFSARRRTESVGLT